MSGAPSARLAAAALACLLFPAGPGGAAPAGPSPARDPSPAAPAQRRFDEAYAGRLAPLLVEVIRFPTVQGDVQARLAQQAWLLRTAGVLGLQAREAGLITEVELAGPPGAPVLGLVVHGDVQPADPSRWRRPPFAGIAEGGVVHGRGAADDKGPLVQALLALAALRDAGPPLTHTVRLLVGSDEESDNLDLKTWLSTHRPPDLSLVLDADFPVMVGERAWQALAVSAPPEPGPRPGAERFPFAVEAAEAGLAASIVPDRARLALRWRTGAPGWAPLRRQLSARTPDRGTRLRVEERGAVLALAVTGRAAHTGMNLGRGRNALVSLARLAAGLLPPGPEDDLLAFARLAGRDGRGTGLGLLEETPGWGRTLTSVALLRRHEPLAAPGQAESLTLLVNLRRAPPLSGPGLRARLEAQVAAFNARTGARLVAGGFYDDEPLVLDPRGKLARLLLESYRRATGRDDPPAVTGGGTYAKRLPNAIAFGMWFPGTPYPGHDVDEAVPIADLRLGTRALLEAVVAIACAPPLRDPLLP